MLRLVKQERLYGTSHLAHRIQSTYDADHRDLEEAEII